MSKVELCELLQSIHGVLRRNEDGSVLIARYAHGAQQVYVMKKQKEERTDGQKAHTALFKQAIALADLSYKDEEMRARWQAEYDECGGVAYGHQYVRLREYIIGRTYRMVVEEIEKE